VLGTTAAMTAALTSSDKESRLLWGLATALMAAVAPYTALVMIPAHNKLLRQVPRSRTQLRCTAVQSDSVWLQQPQRSSGASSWSSSACAAINERMAAGRPLSPLYFTCTNSFA
jgi:hypothetical protein